MHCVIGRTGKKNPIINIINTRIQSTNNKLFIYKKNLLAGYAAAQIQGST